MESFFTVTRVSRFMHNIDISNLDGVVEHIFVKWLCMCGPRRIMKTFFLSHQHISKRAVRISLEKKLASRGWSVPAFLRNSIATCDFPGLVGPTPCTLLDLYIICGLSQTPMVSVPFGRNLRDKS